MQYCKDVERKCLAFDNTYLLQINLKVHTNTALGGRNTNRCINIPQSYWSIINIVGTTAINIFTRSVIEKCQN